MNFHETYADLARAKIERLSATLTEMEELADDLREFLQGQEDAEYHTDGPPSPNQAMRLLMRLNELFPEEKP